MAQCGGGTPVTAQTVGGDRVLHPEHPLSGLNCPLCGHPLAAGPITLVLVSPGTGGRRKPSPWPTATAVPVHAECARVEPWTN